MKGRVIMIRDLTFAKIGQDSKSGFFNLTDGMKAINTYRIAHNLNMTSLPSYKERKSTKEFLKALSDEENIPVKDLIKLKRLGNRNSTWAHPLVFADLIMWGCPTFKVKVLKWLHDNLLEYRNESGITFKEMNKALNMRFNVGAKTWIYSNVAKKIYEAVGVGDSKDKWQKATEEQLKLRNKIQETVKLLAYEGKQKNAYEVVDAAIGFVLS